MPPTGWESGNRNSRLTQRLGNWADADGTGLAFDWEQRDFVRC
ncbi:Endonuclease, Uma2 family [Nostoc flagelliforme CCNUN1]|uniref:Endonuclease, Uma2 family n=1 Tax=Nostoc flagelliforme CCNUN1 TaxID=2038116 RepID=A0A2K8SPA7_9NOSO|nr:Endonuclease, Uma2 family [Nostoc flagelliforme CCNUN1]